VNFYLEKCKSNPNLRATKDESGNEYRFLILGRGEDVFFEKNGFSLFCTMDAVNRKLFVQSIKLWEENKKKIGKKERNGLAQEIKLIYEKLYGEELELVVV